MILSDFTPKGSVGTGLEKIFLAEVTVTEGWLFWRRVERRQIARQVGDHWAFTDTGEFCPGFQCENMERIYRMRDALTQLHSNNGTDSASGSGLVG